MYLIAAARCGDGQALRSMPAETQRLCRRFNLPVQLAVAAAMDAAGALRDPGQALIVSLAPCNNGSPALFGWVRTLQDLAPQGLVHTMRVNPTVTLHAVDNLALSALEIGLESRRGNIGLGGTAGMAWEALALVQGRMDAKLEQAALVVAGDQDSGETGAGALGLALAFAAGPAPYGGSGAVVELRAIERDEPGEKNAQGLSDAPGAGDRGAIAHSAAGLAGLLAALDAAVADGAGRGPWRYEVPAGHGDGGGAISVVMDIRDTRAVGEGAA